MHFRLNGQTQVNLSTIPNNPNHCGSRRWAGDKRNPHAQSTYPQVIAFYDRHNLRIMEYEMRPIGFPCAITLANRDAFTFDNGLKVNTGH